jgi:enoyl-CoA hydratase/carnithine racemase
MASDRVGRRANRCFFSINPGEIGENSALGLIATRMTMRGIIADRVRKATDHELEEQTRLRKTEDFKEGVKSVFERRLPNFTGH